MIEPISKNHREETTQKENEAGPVFIVGMNGSGTTMLADCLGRHPVLFAYHRETKLFPYFIKRIHLYGDLNDDNNIRRLWDDVRSIEPFRIGKHQDVVPIPDNWRELPRNLRTVINNIMQYFSLKEGKKRWCEKTPMYVLHMQDISKVFPDSKFIHIVRDGRDCSASVHRRWKRNPELSIFRWKKIVAEGRKEASALGNRYFELRYEDLTMNPELWMKKICTFLDVEFDDVVLFSSQPWKNSRYCKRKVEIKGGASAGKIVPNSGKWRDQFDEKQIERMEIIAGKILNDFGYSTEKKLSDEDPSVLKRSVWLYGGFIRQGFSLFWSILRGRTKIPWWRFLSWVTHAFKQRSTTRY